MPVTGGGGWKKWKDGEVIDDGVVRVADDPTKPVERDELDDDDKSTWPVINGEPRDPWVCENQLPVEDIETGDRFLFVTPTFGGKVAVEQVCKRYASNIRKGLDKGLPTV